MPTRNGSAQWRGDLQGGDGTLKVGESSYEGPYSFKSRFEEGEGTNPEELIAAAQAACYSMQLSAMLAGDGHTPDSVDTSLGTLKFDDGIPSEDTAQKAYDQLDLQRGVEAFLNGLRGVSIYAARKGIREAGAKDNEGVLIFSGLMDANSLFLTANADTVYFIANIDLSKGPIVVETPPDTLGLFDDHPRVARLLLRNP